MRVKAINCGREELISIKESGGYKLWKRRVNKH